MSIKPYPKYKDSGVEWLGMVPEGWEIDRFKWSIIICQNGIWGDEPNQDENDIPCVRVADFDRQQLRVVLREPTIRNVSEKKRVGRVLNRGNLLLEKSGGGETQPVGCVVLYDDLRPAVCSNFVARVQVAAQMDASFWRYAHAAAYAVRLNTRSIKQTSGIQNLDSSQYFDERAGFPPIAEQSAIACFLDHETSKIDALIAEQEKLIELLKEKRSAVISHAVTKGLNPKAKMKPAGIEWLGDVPEHWKVSRIKRISQKISKGSTPTTIGVEFADEGVRFIKGENITDKGISRYPEFFISENTHQLMSRSELHARDVLVVIAGTIGKAAVLDESMVPANTSQAIAYIRLRDPNIADYVNLWFGSDLVKTHLVLGTVKTAQPNLSMEDLGNVPFILPSTNEIESILSTLTAKLYELDALNKNIERAIDLLQERRSALISAAVTGQIDVRDFNPSKAA